MPGRGLPFTSNFASNGERIYFTATNQQGERILYRGGPPFGGMMMASLTCASCHGVDGRGGLHLMHMQLMDAPPIYFQALQQMAHDEEGIEMYTLADFRLAVVEGKHPDGEALSPNMPRWQMSDADLSDLFEFLKTLSP